jgi:methyl-accepting chemotaxis protein
MSIAKRVHWAVLAIVALLTLGTLAVLAGFNQVRIGGPLDSESRRAADYIADILPPPAYIIESYLEATLLLEVPPTEREAHVDRLHQLFKDYQARQDFWSIEPLPADLKAQLVEVANAPARSFWAELHTKYIPAVRAGDRPRALESYARLAAAYAAHRAAIDKAVLMAQRYQADVKARARTSLVVALGICVVFGLVTLVILFGADRYARRHLTRPLAEAAEALRAMAAGRHDVTIEGEDRPDEIGEIARAFAVLHSATDEKVQLERAVSKACENIRVGLAEIRAASDDLARRTESQSVAIEHTVKVMEQVSESVGETAMSAVNVAAFVSEAQTDADQGGWIVNNAIGAMEGIQKSSQEINQIVNMIDGIAFQTNLLALNAGVEAARAGDAGKGFAVVAQEVRALAQRSADAARDIKALIGASSAQVEKGVALVQQSGDSLKTIVGKINSVSDLMAQIASAARAQASGIKDVKASISEMSESTLQNAAMVEESTAATHSLAAQADTLGELIGNRGTSRPRLLAAPAPPPAAPAARAPRTQGNLALAPREDEENWEDF